MLFTLVYNDSWSVGLIAEKYGLRMRRSGNFGGWLTLDQVEELQDAGYRIRVF